MTKWVDIDFWNIKPIYKINEDGLVINKNTHNIKLWDIDDEDYARVTLYDINGKRKKFRVNRLVAKAFLPQVDPNLENILIAHHKNHNTLDNHFSNLEWVTQSENQIYSRKAGNTKAKMSEDDAYKLCKMIVEGKTTNEILQNFNIGPKKKDPRFAEYVRRISAIKHKKVYVDIYEKCLLESSTTIENEEEYYTIN